MSEELHQMAVRLHEIIQYENAGLSRDELTALGMARQLLDWASRPAEEVHIVTKKPSITFGTIKLGED